MEGGGGRVVRRGGGCGTRSIAAITFENDSQIVFFERVFSIFDLVQVFGQAILPLPYLCGISTGYRRAFLLVVSLDRRLLPIWLYHP